MFFSVIYCFLDFYVGMLLGC